MPAQRELAPVEGRIMVALAWMATAAILVVPLAVTPDLLDRFRVIKESVCRAEALLGLLLIVIAVAFGSTERLREMLRERAIAAVTVAGLVWAAITTLTSTHHLWSTRSLVSFVTSVLVALTVWYAAPRISLTILDVLVPATLINTVLAGLQQNGIYQPFAFDPELTTQHLMTTALIGNPNIVGSYSALVMIILAAAALRVPGWRRWLYTFGMFAAGAGLFISRTRTAVIAAIVGFAVLVIIALSARRAVILAAAIVVAFGAAYMLDIGGVRRVVSIPDRITARDLESATSGRLTPALVALAMFRDHPVTGVGPGAFRYEYMPYQAQIRERYDTALPGRGSTNFAETHNDHLQMLAEAGLPGYALFLAAITAIILHTRRSPADDVRGAAMKSIVPPLAATFLMLALGQFPLHVPITRHLLVTMAGLAIGWSARWSQR